MHSLKLPFPCVDNSNYLVHVLGVREGRPVTLTVLDLAIPASAPIRNLDRR